MRRIINLILIGLAFYGGLKFERMLHEGRCQSEGGQLNAQGFCDGARRS